MSEPLPDFDLSQFLPYRLAVAAQRASAGLAGHYRSTYGINVGEWRVLVHLLDAGEVSVRDLGETVNLDKSKASRAASWLAEQGYITKTENELDRRLVRLSLTPKGRELMAQILPLAIAFQARLESILDEHLDGLNEALEKLMTEEL